DVFGEYCSRPNTTSFPTVYASALTASADSAARSSVCTRTLLKLCPARGSINARVFESRGFPGERSTSSTIVGTVESFRVPVRTGGTQVLLGSVWVVTRVFIDRILRKPVALFA